MNLEYAMKMLDLSLEFNNLHLLLMGKAYYMINAKNGYGEDEHNYVLVMLAIYKKYETDKRIANTLQECITKNLKEMKNGTGVISLLSIIKYQMTAEKEGRAPFKLDCEMLLKLAKDNIIHNKEIYEKHIDTLPNLNIMREFEFINKDLERNHNVRIL